ncbi:MAG: VWA domain-containing protein [Bryobacteraceae bacterium]
MRKLLFLLAASTLAQDVTFTVDTKLVVVNITVRDKAGRVVTNLKKEDFRIIEDNAPQTIASFDLQELSAEPMAPLSTTGSAQTLETRNPQNTQTAAVRAAQVARDMKQYEDRRLIGLFFDLSSMGPAEQVRARDAAIKYLQTQMTRADLVSVMTFGNKFRVLADFTDDRETLIALIRGIATGEGSDLAALSSTGADADDDSGAFAADDTEFNIFNTDRKLTALEDAAHKLAVYPEKKALIYFSGGIEKTGIENESQLKATVNAAVRANVSVYAVDTRGLVASAPGGDASSASPRGTSILSGTRQRSDRASMEASQDSLFALAADTGGKALFDTNDLTLVMKQAQDDIRSYYTLTYTSTNTAEDGRYRRIRVQLVNSAYKDYKLDYRNGYYANKQFKNFTSADKERQLEEALTLGDPVSELPLALEVDYFRVAKDRYFVPISVKMPGSTLLLAKKGGKQSADLDFIGQVRDSSGRLVGGVRDKITINLTNSDAEKLDQRHLQYDTGLTLSPGTYNLVFLAREGQTGKMGTFETKFEIPDLNSVKSMRLSSVILSSQKEAVSAAVGAADNNKKLMANHPLVQDGQKIVPSITRVFRKDQTLHVYFEVYDPTTDVERKTPNLFATVDLLQGARKAFTSAPVRVNQLLPSRPGVAAFQLEVPMARINPGEYTSQVNVIDPLGQKFSFPRNTLVVLP